MKKILLRTLTFGLMVVAIFLAVSQPQKNYYPTVGIETNDPAEALNVAFLLERVATLSECEAITGNIARVTMQSCPQCRIKKLGCKTELNETERTLLTETPLSMPSGRMANGAITFNATNAQLALDACQASAAHSAKSVNPIQCHAANTPRTKPPVRSIFAYQHLFLFLAAFAAACLTGWLIIRYEHLHAHFSHDHIDSGPQKYHAQPTPRIGGLAIFFGLLAGGGIMLFEDALTSERAFGLLLLSGVPAFLGGLTEDITKKVGVLERLLLTMLSGACAAWLLGAVLGRLDVPGIDQALIWLPFAVVLTAFAVGGISNSINIIDGYNGLASGVAVIVLCAMAYVAHVVGDRLIFSTSLALAGTLLGFMVWNWPYGKIFLGDGGAYLVGFILAELSVLIVVRNPNVSPWFPLLLLIYPIFETIYSIYRRHINEGLSLGKPDNRHIHQLIHDHLIPPAGNNGKHFHRNCRVAKYLWAPAAVVAVLGGLFWESTPTLIACAAGFCVFYVVNYRRLDRIASKFSGNSTAPPVTP